MIIRIPRKTMVDDWDLPYGGNRAEGVEVIEDNIESHTRWSVHHDLIFRVKDKVYRTFYSIGATEYQDERPWDDSFADCEEVKQVERVILEWVAVDPAPPPPQAVSPACDDEDEESETND